MPGASRPGPGLLGVSAATWARLSPLLDAALELPETERSVWLARLQGPDAELREPLQRLLQQTPRPFLAAGALAERAALDGRQRQPGDRVGPYRLVQALGAGGMGEVWLADRADGELRRQVALKLPHAEIGSPGLKARLARERDILASLVHPNIARLYDAGVSSEGHPYLALEVVNGRPIDIWCSDQALGVAARLRLFLQVARAVAYAHTRLVVHRDLKPSNLLVDDAGSVKLLDFGIAKLIDEPTTSALTATGGAVMTPGYASPEQVSGQPVGTSSDVYSLGVVLYELLAGTGPYLLPRDSRAALEEAVLTSQPRRPSEAAADAERRKALRGDLDTIVLHALHKSPADRYPTVDALADDIERHLQHRPLRARPDGGWVALRKLVRRHRLAFGAGSAIFAAVLAGAGAAAWQARLASAERQRAEQVKEFVVAMLRDASPYFSGDVNRMSAADLVRQAQRRLVDAAIAHPAARVELFSLIGESLLSLGDLDAAEAVLDRTSADARAALGERHLLTLRARLLQSQVQRFRGRIEEQRATLAELLPMLRERAREDATLPVVGLQYLTLNAIDRGAYGEAAAAAVEGERLAAERLGERHPEMVASAILLALAHRYQRRFDLALPAAERALQLTRAAYPGPGLHPRVVEARAVRGRALGDVGRLVEGVGELQAARDDALQLFGNNSPLVGTLQQNLVAYLVDLGELAAAELNARESVRIVKLHAQAESFSHAGTLASLGAVLLAQRRADEALALLAPAADTLARVLGPGHDAALLVRTQQALALALLGRLDEAGQLLASNDALFAGAAVASATRAKASIVHAMLARLRGEPAAAIERLRPLLADAGAGADADAGADINNTDTNAGAAPKLQRERMRARIEAGQAHLALARSADAAAAFEAALRDIERLEIAPTPARADALAGLARARHALSRRQPP